MSRVVKFTASREAEAYDPALLAIAEIQVRSARALCTRSAGIVGAG
jgi:hypothetical protein